MRKPQGEASGLRTIKLLRLLTELNGIGLCGRVVDELEDLLSEGGEVVIPVLAGTRLGVDRLLGWTDEAGVEVRTEFKVEDDLFGGTVPLDPLDPCDSLEAVDVPCASSVFPAVFLRRRSLKNGIIHHQLRTLMPHFSFSCKIPVSYAPSWVMTEWDVMMSVRCGLEARKTEWW